MMRDSKIDIEGILFLLAGIFMLFYDVIIYYLKLKVWFKESDKHGNVNTRLYPPRKRKPYHPKK